jgi:glucose-6-phosphate-specific signal transduction histidine kinase
MGTTSREREQPAQPVDGELPDRAQPDGPRLDDGLFPARLRRLAIAAVVAAAALSAVGGRFVDGERAFLAGWVLAGSLLFVALAAMGDAVRRTRRADRQFWRLWLVGSAFAGLFGLALLAYALAPDPVDEARMPLVLVYLSALAANGFWNAAVLSLVRSRFGRAAMSVAMLDWLIGFSAVALGCLLLSIRPAATSASAWFALPCALAGCMLTAALVPCVALYLGAPRRRRFAEAMLLGLTSVSVVNAWLLVANALHGFTYAAAPLLAVQAVDMGLMLLFPLYSPRSIAARHHRTYAADRGPQDLIISVLLLGGVVFFVTQTVPQPTADVLRIAIPIFAALVALAAVRSLVALRRTTKLYREVEERAEEQQRIVANLRRVSDQERRTVAEQLHGELLSTLVGIRAARRATGESTDRAGASGDAMDQTLSRISGDLTARVESLRELMLAVPPTTLDEHTVVTELRASFSELFRDRPPPALTIDVDPELELDWTTRTILSRIVHEATRHLPDLDDVSRVEVRLQWLDEKVILEITIDEPGPARADAVSAESRQAIRTLAELAHGSGRIDVSGGRTRVRAVLDPTAAMGALTRDEPQGRPDAPSDGSRAPLRLVEPAPVARP